MSEHRQCTRARAVAFFDPTADDKFHQVEILAHLPEYRLATRRWGSLSRGATAGSVFSTIQMPADALDSSYHRTACRGSAMSFERIRVAPMLFTPMTAGCALLPVVADFNKTHATNPLWTPHARFHVVWQISSYVGLGLLAFALIWWPGPLAVERLYLVAAMGTVVYAAFFAALIAMPIYGGAADDKNGYQPFDAPVPIFAKKWDVNITAFSVQLVILLAGLLTISGTIAG